MKRQIAAILGRHSIAMGDIDSVNLTNGNASLTVPLAQLASARGAAGVGYYLRYSSKLYAKTPEEVTVSNSTFTVDLLQDSPEGGWRFVEGPVLETKDNGYRFSHIPPTHPNNYRVCSLRLVMPGGTSYEMAPWGAGRRGDEFTCFRDTQYSSLTGAKVYFSVDGSFARATLDSSGTYKIFFPDGGRIVSEPGQPTYIYDRNGNWVRNGLVTLADSSQVPGWIDNFGRYIAKKYIDDDEDRVYATGFDGGELYWTVKWKTIGVKRKYTARGSGLQQGGQYETNYCSQMRVLDEVVLPSQMGSLDYEFTYYGQDNYDPTSTCGTSADYTEGFGEVKQIKMPLGSKAIFNYKINANLGLSESYSASQIIEKSGSATTKSIKYLAEYDGASPEVTEVWGYSNGASSGSITKPDGSVTSQLHYHATNDAARGGTPYKTVNPDGSVVERIYAYNNPHADVRGPDSDINPYVKTEFISIPNASGTLTQTSVKDYEYDKNGNVTKVTEYDWQPYGNIGRDGNDHPNAIPSVTPARITETAYHNNTPAASDSSTDPTGAYWNGAAQRFLGAVKSTVVRKPTSTTASDPIARTETDYDDPLTTANPTATRVFDSFKGNQTRSYSDPLTSTNSISTSIQYNSTTKLPEVVTDAMSVQTTYTYGCIDGQTTCPANRSGLWPTKTETASNHSSVKRTATATYDAFTGKVKRAKDADNDVSVVTEYDALGRPTKVRSAADSTLESWTVTQYDDANRRIVVKADLNAVGDGKKVSTQFFDQLGRVRLAKTLEDAATQSATNLTDGIKVETRYMTNVSCFTDKKCTYVLTSNPFRAASSTAATGETTMGWTLSLARSDGQYSEVETFNGASLPGPFAGPSPSPTPNGSSTGKVKNTVDANNTTVEDQAGKVRRSVTNALGQLVRVDEPNASNQLDVSGTPYQPTAYTYDVLGNLLTVTQAGTGIAQCGPGWVSGTCSQTRTFAYSSLSRLLTAANPESGTISYGYDANGNLVTKTDARGVKTDYVYDALNRVTNRNYSLTGSTPANYQATPDVTYTYGTIAPAIGRLTKVTNGVGADRSTTEYTSFDILGRVTAHKQTTDGQEFTTDYTYNLSGALVEQTYPSGRKVQNVLDNNGDLEMVKSRKNANSGYWAYANNFTYNPTGAVTSMQLGNGTWESTAFNSRLQPTEIYLGTTSGGHDKLKLNYGYGDWVSGSIDGTKNNGNVVQQVITVPTVGSSAGFLATQKYYYDSLNRIDDSTEDLLPHGGSSTQTWRQDFGFDRFGNRNFNEQNTSLEGFLKQCSGNTVLCPALKKKLNPSINPADNRVLEDQDSDNSDDYRFDSAGNTTKDPNSRKFTYDGENKQVKVEMVNSQDQPTSTIGEYLYDGDGRRVKKHVPYVDEEHPGEVTIFVYDAAGKLVVEYSTVVPDTNTAKVAYLTNDHLDSPRVNTDKNGNVTARHDYHPFGREIYTSQRNGLGYADDTVRKQFTAYERDRETELDFAQARYHDFNLGRFRSADPLMASGRLSDPQTWNRYVYVLNNPLRFVDPTGMSEQGGTKIVHGEKRPVVRIEDFTVLITAEPSKTIPSKEYKDLETGETIVRNVFDINVTLSDTSGRAVPTSAYIVQTVGLDENGRPSTSESSREETQPDGSVKMVRSETENYTAPGEPYTVTANSNGSDNTSAEVESDRHRTKITTSSSAATIEFSTTRFNGVVSVDPAYDRTLSIGPARVQYVADASSISSVRRVGIQTVRTCAPLGN